ncbi:Sbal_3080 family lipoprotein [Methylophaga sp.]|uniref:Sbal_3080 family lipoprotein n=1 Tax=Methylophaga sp. TaxID=2024840 RepID=UPI0025E4A807|nr:Sbal_3080 family lipoprotein [Methylophaga sp.]
MFKNIGWLLLTSLTVTGCSIKQTVEPAEIPEKAELCIIENTDTREGFLKEFQSTLSARGIQHQLVSARDVPESCEWTATYVARWTWDLALYMSYAEIKIFRNGNLDGEAIYDSTHGGGNMGKFIDAEPKIQELVNELMQFKSSSAFGLFFS